jgi:DNA-binding beta-propeller fold protein YncE
MHLLPRVREIEEAFPDDLVVIGVHAGKYPAERDTLRLTRACERLRVRHAVVNDRQYRIWRSYGVQAWPTLALVSPDGHLVAVRPGESAVDQILALLGAALPGRVATVAAGDSAVAVTKDVLHFPARVIAAAGNLYVSDSGHDRVLELSMGSGRVEPVATVSRAWGGTVTGFADGPADVCAFDAPQGLAIVGEALYVADRGNHAVRAIDLASGDVTTAAGTGRLAPGAIRPGVPISMALRSPWALARVDGTLLVAMAGAHQLWRLDVDRSSLLPVAGTGGEAIADGPASSALLAQPTGLTAAGDVAYFADCESSAVRMFVGGARPEVRTIVGTGLFDFGDRDGMGDEVRLQHAEDLVFHDGSLYVADTYNDRIKVLDPVARACRSLPGPAGGGTVLSGPAGIASLGGLLVVADTDAHRLVFIDPADGSLTPLEVR